MNAKHALLIFTSALALGSAGCKAPATLQVLKQRQAPPPPDTITLNLTNYVAPTGRRLRDIFVSNFTLKATKGKLETQTSWDMPDSIKEKVAASYGFLGGSPYSTGLAFSDLFFWLAGITQANQNMLYCADTLRLSSSNDAFIFTDAYGNPQFLGMRDCEKSYIGLRPDRYDYDGDGIPDYLELRCATNPKNSNDAAISAAADGVSNIEKCKRNIPNDELATSQSNVLFSYKYQKDLQSDGSLSIKISNIPVVNGGKDNFVAIYLTETNVSATDGSTSADTTGYPYLYTAYALLKENSSGKTFNFPFWARRPSVATADPTTYTNQGLQFE